jgi:23S rRNA (uracil1939-C5)-methyltransferase
MTPSNHSLLQLFQIKRLAFGGQGVSHNPDGKTTFIPYTIPGEEVHATVIASYRKHDQGKLIQIITPSLQRQRPPCPYFTQCGGCQLQHMSYDLQIEFKANAIRDSLTRIGKITNLPSITSHPSPTLYHYRRRIRVRWIPSKQAFGFASDQTAQETSEDGTFQSTPIQECLLFKPVTGWTELLVSLSQRLVQIPDENSIELDLTLIHLEERRGILLFESPKPLFQRIINLLHSAIDPEIWVGSFFLSAGIPYSSSGKKHGIWEIQGIPFLFSALSFMQNHWQMAQKLYETIFEDLKSLSEKPNHLLDLYCGVGILTNLVAPLCHKITGIEISSEAISTAKHNASISQQHLTSPAPTPLFHCAPSQQLPRYTKIAPTHLIINPPRTGIDNKTLLQIQKLSKVQRIYYISCMPTTLARDLKELLSFGFELLSLHAFDLFPQTTHVETLVILQRKSITSVSLSIN